MSRLPGDQITLALGRDGNRKRMGPVAHPLPELIATGSHAVSRVLRPSDCHRNRKGLTCQPRMPEPLFLKALRTAGDSDSPTIRRHSDLRFYRRSHRPTLRQDELSEYRIDKTPSPKRCDHGAPRIRETDGSLYPQSHVALAYTNAPKRSKASTGRRNWQNPQRRERMQWIREGRRHQRARPSARRSNTSPPPGSIHRPGNLLSIGQDAPTQPVRSPGVRALLSARGSPT